MWYIVKVLRIRYNLFAGTETLSLSVSEPIAKTHFGWGGGRVPSPNLEGRGKARGRVRYPVKAHHNVYNLLIETDTLSLFV